MNKVNLEKFENTLKDWGFGYPEWAGCRLVQDEKAKVKHKAVDPEQDCIMYDERCNEGTFGISHDESGVIFEIKITNAKKFDINYRLKPKQKAVSTYELLYRYMWIRGLFTHWEFKRSVSPLDYSGKFWKTFKDVNKSFKKEINLLENDPHLALYWLLHKGFTCDKKGFKQVKSKIVEFNLADELTDIHDALAWFEKHDIFYNMPVKHVNMFEKTKHEPDADDLFLIRREHLLWVVYSYDYRGGAKAFEKWWLSVALYPKAEEFTIRKMRWLCNNLNKYNKWDLLEKKLKTNKAEISLLNYVLALNPNEKNKSKYADALLKELEKGKNIWKNDTAKKFAQAMIHDLKDEYTDTHTLKQVMQCYFVGHAQSKEYKELVRQFFGKSEQVIIDVSEDIEKLQNILQKGIRDGLIYIEEDDDLTPKVIKTFKNAKEYLSSLNEDEITTIVNKSITNAGRNETLIYTVIEYLFENKIKNREELLVLLIDNCNDGAEFLLRNFLKTFIKDDNDPNYELIRKLYEECNSDLAESLPFAFINVVHQKTIFNNWFINVFDHIPEEKVIKITEYVFNNIDYYGRMKQVNAIPRFDKTQLEQMCEKIIEALCRLKDDKHDFHNVLNYLSEISNNDLSKDWFESYLKNVESFIATFSDEFKKKRIADVFDYICYKLKVTKE